MKSMERLRAYLSASVCTLLIAYFTLVSYSAFFSFDQNSPWPWPSCRITSSSSPVTSFHIAQRTSSQFQTPTNLSHIVFGIGGSANTWNQRRAYSELWWRPNKTRGYVWLDDKPSGTIPDTFPPYKISSDTSRYENSASASRIAMIVMESFRLVQKSMDTRWFVMGDDDTVFFVENLLNVLGKYDHEQMYYVGMPSETVEQDVKHGYGMAFGGGGFAISFPAAEALTSVMNGCLDRYSGLYGSDERVHSCLIELGIPLTREPGFHQTDLRGDLYGYLSAHPIVPLITLHHLDYVKPIIPNISSQLDSLKILVSAYKFDPARILQQTFCYELGSNFSWSVSVSWGYSVQIYPWILSATELEMPLQTFSTWRNTPGPFIFNTREFNQNDACGLPFIFFLDKTENKIDQILNATVTEYTQYKILNGNNTCNKLEFKAASKITRVRVLAPKMDASYWKMAPRRQCCVTSRTGMFEGTLEVRIKSCTLGESTTSS